MPRPPIAPAVRRALPLLLAAAAPACGGDSPSGVREAPPPVAAAAADLSPLGPLSPAPAARPGDAYTIAVRLASRPDARLEAPVREAAARWARVVGAGLTPYRVDLSAGACAAGTPAVHEVVPDLLVLVRFAELDGEGGLLGTAGPCVLRPDDADGAPGLPIVGVVTLDVDDALWLAELGQTARLRDVATHEIGHVLGIGVLWGRRVDGVRLVPGLGVAGADLLYVGRGAVRASAALGFTAGGAPVPVELDDALLRGRHWRRSVYGGEVMTGWVGDGPAALSALSVGALADLGYDVRPAEADPFRRAGGAAPGDTVSGEGVPRPDVAPAGARTAASVIVERVLAPRFVAGRGASPR